MARKLVLTVIIVICGCFCRAESGTTVSLESLIGGMPMLNESSDKVLQLHNRDVVAYYDLEEYNTPLKVKNFQKTEEYKELLDRLEEERAPYYSAEVFAKTYLGFDEYNLRTGKIWARINCYGDLLSRSIYHKNITSYFDAGDVFSGVKWSGLPLVPLSLEERSYGIAWYALELTVTEEVAARLENNAVHVYLLGKISGSRDYPMFEYEYWEHLSSGSGYPSPRVTKSVPVVSSFKLVLTDSETEEIIYVKSFAPKK